MSLVTQEETINDVKKKKTGTLRSKQTQKGVHIRARKAATISSTDLTEQTTMSGTVNIIGRMDDPAFLLRQALPESVSLNPKRPVSMSVCGKQFSSFWFF